MAKIQTLNQSPSPRRAIFQVIQVGCALFLVLSTLAMPFYAGGTPTNPNARGYSFFHNFFSDLGRTQSYDGRSNLVSAVLFAVALSCAGLGLAAFFVAFEQFFRRPFWLRLVAGFGSFCGVVAGLNFVGVALSPANVLGEYHFPFVLRAFRYFLYAVVIYSAAMLANRDFPRRYALIFVAFALGLVAYLLLITRGPSPESESGLVIQSVGQKLIVYAAVGAIWLQARGAQKRMRK